MKIQNNVGVDTTLPTSGVARSEGRKPAAPAADGSKGDAGTVRIDPRASLLASAETSLASAPTIDAKRIEEIKQAIAEGRFEVDSAKVADRLLGSVRDLLMTRGG